MPPHSEKELRQFAIQFEAHRLARKFVVDDRYDDKNLKIGDIEEAIKNGEITYSSIFRTFAYGFKSLVESRLKLKEDLDGANEKDVKSLTKLLDEAIVEDRTQMRQISKSEADLVLRTKSDKLTFNVPEEFLSLLRQVSSNRGVQSSVVFKELVEQMTEELERELD